MELLNFILDSSAQALVISLIANWWQARQTVVRHKEYREDQAQAWEAARSVTTTVRDIQLELLRNKGN